MDNKQEVQAQDGAAEPEAVATSVDDEVTRDNNHIMDNNEDKQNKNGNEDTAADDEVTEENKGDNEDKRRKMTVDADAPWSARMVGFCSRSIRLLIYKQYVLCMV